MKNSILTLVLALCGLSIGHAQVPADGHASADGIAAAADSAVSPTERNDWLASFDAVSVDGDLDIRFVAIPESEAPHIVYDTKGSYTTKFRFDVRDRELRIREQSDSRRPDRTSVTVYYNALRSVSVIGAVASFDATVAADLFDLTLDSDASLTVELHVRDLNLTLSGESRATLTGQVRYLTLFASAGRVDAQELTCMSARVNAQSRARVRLDVTERLEAKVSTGASVRYKTAPELLRVTQNFLSGSVGQIGSEEDDRRR